MKRSFWAVLLLLAISCSNEQKIEVSGVIESGESQEIYLSEQGIGAVRPRDSATVKLDGSFKLSDKISIPKFYNLRLGGNEIVPLLLHPGDRVVISSRYPGFSSAYEIEGSIESQQILDLNRRLARTVKSIDSIQQLLASADETDVILIEELAERYNQVIKDQRKYSTGFVIENRDKMVAIYALYQRLNNQDFILNDNRDIQLLKITAEALDTIYPGSEHVMSLVANSEQMIESLYARRMQDIVARSESRTPEIRLPDPYGDSISLNAYLGKVVLLSFWASWDRLSISYNLELKNIYSAYNRLGFEIYQVSFDNELEPWMRAIQYDELPWTNVSELSYPESHVSQLFNVTELPTSYLIDKNGDIVRRNPSIRDLDILIPQLIK